MVDRVTRKPIVETYTTTATIPVVDVALLETASLIALPEEWTAAYRKEQQSKQQHQFVLMYDKKDRP
jgi:hypothetical protein